jgi:hypothetical protein
MKEGQHEAVMLEMIRDKQKKLVALKQMNLPPKKDTKAESPLMEAFIAGFHLGTRTSHN